MYRILFSLLALVGTSGFARITTSFPTPYVLKHVLSSEAFAKHLETNRETLSGTDLGTVRIATSGKNLERIYQIKLMYRSFSDGPTTGKSCATSATVKIEVVNSGGITGSRLTVPVFSKVACAE